MKCIPFSPPDMAERGIATNVHYKPLPMILRQSSGQVSLQGQGHRHQGLS